MASMFLPVLCIVRRQGLVVDNEKILGVFFLGAAGEIERPGDHGRPINDHNFVVGNMVGRVDPGRDARRGQVFEG